MKSFLVLVLVVFNYAFAKAQNTPTPSGVPTIGIKLMYGDMVDFGETQIKFAEVVSDSRCPRDVDCVWAGEAKVRVEIYKNRQFSEEKEITFGALSNRLEILSTELLGINALKLQPYPESSIPKDNNEYYLVLAVKEN
jgi:hypothetical protein